MNFWGYMGILFMWIAGWNHTDDVTFWCSIGTSVVFFIASSVKWLNLHTEEEYD